MKSVWLFLGGILTGFLLMGVSYEYHFVMSDEGFLIVPKTRSALKNIYVDIRGWSLQDWGKHPDVARALIQDGRSELITTGTAENTLEQMIPQLSEKPDITDPLKSQRR
jgi:hypothetical protein